MEEILVNINSCILLIYPTKYNLIYQLFMIYDNDESPRDKKTVRVRFRVRAYCER